ncbi:mRNA-capping enzyme subunit beta [Mortierella claussenii]|nr:mRNA-capping enzyme subunit beta [Mortierella claussenii]
MADQEVSKKRPLEQELENEGTLTDTATATTTTTTTTTQVENAENQPSKKARSGEPDTTDSRTQRPEGEQQQQARLPQQQLQQQPQRPSRNDHAFFDTDVLDDVVRTIGEFLFEHCERANVEIEAKLGVLIDKNTGRRIELPVCNETVLKPQGRPTWYQFSSDMTLAQHAHFNKTLNWRLEQTRKTEPPERQIRYQHTREIDQFYSTPAGKTRVTRDQKTNEVIPNGIVKKDRIADLDVYSPRNAFDYRVSVNIEVPVPAPQGVSQFERHKDRISYRHNNFKIDLTQVKTANAPSSSSNHGHNYSQMRPMNNSNNNQDMTHELEIEFVHPEVLARERQVRLNSGGRQADRFMDIVGHFVNNIRGLSARGSVQQQQQQPQQQQPAQQRPR